MSFNRLHFKILHLTVSPSQRSYFPAHHFLRDNFLINKIGDVQFYRTQICKFGGMKFDTHTVLLRDEVLISLFLCLYFFKCCFVPEIHETTKIWHPREQNYLFGHFS